MKKIIKKIKILNYIYDDLKIDNEFIKHYNIVKNINNEQRLLIIYIIILVFRDIFHLQKTLLKEGKLK